MFIHKLVGHMWWSRVNSWCHSPVLSFTQGSSSPTSKWWVHTLSLPMVHCLLYLYFDSLILHWRWKVVSWIFNAIICVFLGKVLMVGGKILKGELESQEQSLHLMRTQSRYNHHLTSCWICDLVHLKLIEVYAWSLTCSSSWPSRSCVRLGAFLQLLLFACSLAYFWSSVWSEATFGGVYSCMFFVVFFYTQWHAEEKKYI
jgi:hypothetical protein